MTEREFHEALDELAYDWTEEHDYFIEDRWAW